MSSFRVSVGVVTLFFFFLAHGTTEQAFGVTLGFFDEGDDDDDDDDGGRMGY